jgi:hypothetical protein
MSATPQQRIDELEEALTLLAFAHPESVAHGVEMVRRMEGGIEELRGALALALQECEAALELDRYLSLPEAERGGLH